MKYFCDVVIIDTGVDQTHNIFKNTNIFGLTVNLENHEIYTIDQFQDEIGHGTAVAGIIASKCPGVRICAIKIFDKNFESDLGRLIAALKFVLQNIECLYIHMSLGVLNYSAELESICKKLHERGCILISAFDNDGAMSFPAALPFVVGVAASPLCTKTDQLRWQKETEVNVLAYGYNQRVAWLGGQFMIVAGSSFSAAYVTAHILKASRFRTKKYIKEQLEHLKKENFCMIVHTILQLSELLCFHLTKKLIIFSIFPMYCRLKLLMFTM